MNKIKWIESANFEGNYFSVIQNVVASIVVETLNHKGQNLDEVIASGGSYNKENFHEYYVCYNHENKKLSMFLASTMNVGFFVD